MAHYAERMRSPSDKARTSPSASPGPQPRRNGPQRSALWHVLQLKAAQAAEPAPGVKNRSGLPVQLQAGVEALSGVAMDDVRVHRNSAEPAKLGALAYTQGSDIHLGPGQERHLAHEAWHVVQQKQGRVQATTQLKGVALNEDGGLEREADAMGAKALAAPVESRMAEADAAGCSAAPAQAVVQRMSIFGTAVASEMSAEAQTKHVVATNDQAAAAKNNYGSTTFVTSAADLTSAADSHNWDFRQQPSTYKNINRYVTVSVYKKTNSQEQGAGKAVSRSVDAASKNCQIGVQKTRNSGRIIITHFKAWV